MIYIDPLIPLFEATRLQIERTIMGLEERLLTRRELDLEIQRDLIEHENLHDLKRQTLSYDNKSTAERLLSQRLRSLKTFDLLSGFSHPSDLQMQREALQLDYISRLRDIQKQKSLMSREYALKNISSYQTTKIDEGNFYPFDESGQILARKYFDGTRAQEYNEELKKSAQQKDRVFSKKNDFVREIIDNKKLSVQKSYQLSKQKELNHSTVKKYLSSTKNYENLQGSGHNFYSNNQSPIKQIQNSSRLNSTAEKIVNMQRQRQDNKSPEKLKLNQSPVIDFMPHLKQKNLYRSRTKSTQPTNQLINVPEHLQYQESDTNSNLKRRASHSRYLSNRQKSSKSLHHNGASRSHLAYFTSSIPIQKKFQLWFTERVKIAKQAKQILEIPYSKDQAQYLQTVLEKEVKCRNQLRDKICKIPSVERKFNVGPVVQ